MTILGFKIWKVTDASMEPSIPIGSYVLVNHWLHLLALNVNNIVLIHHHFYGVILKKVTVIDKYGFIWSKGENQAFESIEKIGPVNKKQIMGKVLIIFKKFKKINNTHCQL